jgi:hypothetical protein
LPVNRFIGTGLGRKRERRLGCGVAQGQRDEAVVTRHLQAQVRPSSVAPLRSPCRFRFRCSQWARYAVHLPEASPDSPDGLGTLSVDTAMILLIMVVIAVVVTGLSFLRCLALG